MNDALLTQIMELKNKPLEELRDKYKEVYKTEATSNNKVYLWRKIAYKLQEIQHGGLAAETQMKIAELIERYDPVNNTSLRPKDMDQKSTKKGSARDRRLPIPGTIIVKEYKGKTLEVKILESSFEYRGKVYKTLTAIAREVTGAHWNGYLFFNL